MPGDTVYVGDEHVQTQASALSFDWLTSRNNPYNVICVNDTGDPATPTTLANTAAVQTTGANAISIANTANNAVYYYGIKFQGHPNLRRIFMYDEFVGHPLRKDYPKEKRQPLIRREGLT